MAEEIKAILSSKCQRQPNQEQQSLPPAVDVQSIDPVYRQR